MDEKQPEKTPSRPLITSPHKTPKFIVAISDDTPPLVGKRCVIMIRHEKFGGFPIYKIWERTELIDETLDRVQGLNDAYLTNLPKNDTL